LNSGKAESFMSCVLCLSVCVLPSVNGDDFNERVLPDLRQVQSSSSKSPASVFLLTQQANRVTWETNDKYPFSKLTHEDNAK